MATVETTARARTGSRVRSRLLRWTGSTLIFVALFLLIWAFVIWKWNDPFTSLYTRWQQHKLTSVYAKVVRTYQPIPLPHEQTISVVDEEHVLAAEARRYRNQAKDGSPIGRIVVPRLGLNMLLINGTDHDSLTKGPGRDDRTYMPGQGQLVYIAGHRTTYLAPFAHIDSLRPGDLVTLRMPYATLVYSVTGHVIVGASDLAVLRSHHHEEVALQACHPRFFATHRYIVWAKPIRVTLRDGHTFKPTV